MYEEFDQMLEDDQISAEEQGFLLGYFEIAN